NKTPNTHVFERRRPSGSSTGSIPKEMAPRDHSGPLGVKEKAKQSPGLLQSFRATWSRSTRRSCPPRTGTGRSCGSAATTTADASAGGFLRFVRRLHRYYDEVRLLVSVHHRLRLLAFPMRTAVLTQQVTTAARDEISQVPIQSLCT